MCRFLYHNKEKHKKRGVYIKKLLVVTIAVLVLFTSCTTFTPVPTGTVTSLDPDSYKVLGHIQMTSKIKNVLGFQFGGTGYFELPQEAMAQYDGCDAVINVYSDVENFALSLFYASQIITLYGTAVDLL